MMLSKAEPKNSGKNLRFPLLHIMNRYTTTIRASSLATDLYSEITWIELGPITEESGLHNGSSVRFFIFRQFHLTCRPAESRQLPSLPMS
jgi:hypothetical protein